MIELILLVLLVVIVADDSKMGLIIFNLECVKLQGPSS